MMPRMAVVESVVEVIVGVPAALFGGDSAGVSVEHVVNDAVRDAFVAEADDLLGTEAEDSAGVINAAHDVFLRHPGFDHRDDVGLG